MLLKLWVVQELEFFLTVNFLKVDQTFRQIITCTKPYLFLHHSYCESVFSIHYTDMWTYRIPLSRILDILKTCILTQCYIGRFWVRNFRMNTKTKHCGPAQSPMATHENVGQTGIAWLLFALLRYIQLQHSGLHIMMVVVVWQSWLWCWWWMNEMWSVCCWMAVEILVYHQSVWEQWWKEDDWYDSQVFMRKLAALISMVIG